MPKRGLWWFEDHQNGFPDPYITSQNLLLYVGFRIWNNAIHRLKFKLQISKELCNDSVSTPLHFRWLRISYGAIECSTNVLKEKNLREYIYHQNCQEEAYYNKIDQHHYLSSLEVDNLLRLLEISKVRPSVVQNSFDPFNQDRVTREFCEKNRIRYMGHR